MKVALDIFRPRTPEADALGAFVAALVLTGLGLICVYSFGGEQVVRQAIWAALAVAASIAVSRVPLATLRRAAIPALGASAVLLALALVLAPTVAGTKRWLVIPSVGVFQPSELAKIAVVLFLASRLADAKPGEALLPRVWQVIPVCALVLLAPDLGTTVFLAAVITALLLVAGARVGRLLVAGASAAVLLLIVASQVPYMRKRLDFFEGELNYQQVQALIAFGSGGLMGKGLGAGRQKLDYLPAGHTDFVLPNLGEELGFLGVALVGLLFGLLCVYGVRVAIAAARKREMFGFFVACGATFLVVFQAVVNIAVATAAAPTKGISLPFLSQGGSNLLAALLATGLVVNVGRSLEARR
ncbi:MAG TPA: FtsW/RodA/SpoVE family cell cycle protein [Planctomycetota bacterium]|nr:FtsW/RodA/SpoVE family cell cycle protein [Planctomycetota bacterium]